ncbi:MAG: tRNA (N(6)-L-threonylcarbamoyladenosine(37)-C(2))-methylthiotransferase MtaB [Victivallaceae bacterium]
MNHKKAIITTLGCRLNTADTALLTDRLERAGYTVVDPASDPERVELLIVNSCAVTAEAERKSRQLVRQLAKRFPGARRVLTGCAAELADEGGAWSDAVDAILPNPSKRNLNEFFDAIGLTGEHSLDAGKETFSEDATGRFPFKSRAFLKIQEGCENFCSYCIVPYVRGPERSRDFDEILADCRRSLAAGFAELVLTGVNTATYRDGARNLGDLVREIAKFDGDFRIRLSSTEPHPANLALLEVMASEPKVCRFLHLSLQHGDDRILTAMNRKYRAADYAAFVAEARKLIPGIAIGSDVIVGFPGETDADFESSRRFIRAMEFANTHLFSYSPRPGTPAAKLPGRVPAEVVKSRYNLLKQEAETARRNFIRSELARGPFGVIFEEERSDGLACGWSDHYIQLRVPAGTVPLEKIVRRQFSASDAPELLS